MKRKFNNNLNILFKYSFLIAFGYVFLYPFLFLISSSFKTDAEIMTSLSLIPKEIVLTSYIRGWAGVGRQTFGHFMLNSFQIVIPVVIFTIISSCIVSYGFARFRFRLRNLFFYIMISTLMLPNAVTIIPKYILFVQLGWINTYKVFIIPSMFAVNSFFIYMMMQYMRGIPKELDEAAFVDGCSTFDIFLRIMMPLCKPAVFSIAIFQTVWTWNDFFNPLIFISRVQKYTVMQALRMSMDTTTQVSWGPIMAMAFISMIPCIVLYFTAQDYFIEGIATTGIKG